MFDLRERLIDKLGVDVQTIQAGIFKSGDMEYYVQPDENNPIIGHHTNTGNKFTYLWTDSLDTFSWVDALMGYDNWTPRLGEVIRLLDTMPNVFISAVSEGCIGLDGDVSYIDSTDYLAFVTWNGECFDIMDGANGDQHVACTAEGVIDRLKWCIRFNEHYHTALSTEILKGEG